MTDAAPILDSQQPQQPLANPAFERLRDAAGAAANWDVAHRPENIGTFPARARADKNELNALESRLAASSRSAAGTEGSPHPELLEMRKNFRLLRSAIASVSDSPRSVAQLPRIIHNSQTDEPRVAAAASIYLRAVDGEFSVPTFRMFIVELQTYEALNLEEMWSFGGFLKFALLELILTDARALLQSRVPSAPSRISVCIKSLRDINGADWVSIVEPLIAIDATLRLDPAQAYGAMDFESRELYRKRVAFIARHSDHSEVHVAQQALQLARESAKVPSEDPRIARRRVHVGYYLFDKGLPQLAARVEFHAPLVHRIRAYLRANAEDFYIVSIELITVFFIAAVMFPVLSRSSVTLLAVAAALALLPVSQDAVELVNNAVTTIFTAQRLPKLDFSKGIPLECATLVVVPALLLNEAEVRKLVVDLEVRYLGNRDPHLHFALLTDLPDSITKPRDNDAHPLVDLAIQLIDNLDAKYASKRRGAFLLLHRHRIFNTRQGVWMGWERKRGKLLDLNKLLVGEFDAFPIKAGRTEVLSQIRYILTLDADTQLPRDAAAKMIGAIAHPLNQAVIDPKLRIVTEGYGILQPRVGITVHSASRSRLATIYSGQSGFDVYSRAISDAYQDLFGEGSFTGKGIYEVSVFHAVLDRRFPRNALLSHDLIEGAYTRAGLVADVEVIDDYPSHYSAYTRRKHRWVRGDWQITQWVFGRVPEESGRWVPNPISIISRWKIFDNLRRSLVEPFTLILFVAGWLGLPGGPLYWTLAVLLMAFFPAFVVLGFSLGSALLSDQDGHAVAAFSSFGKASIVAFLNFIFLPHQTLLSLDAIVRSLIRRFITGKRLLEWETAAQSESQSVERTPVDRYLRLTPFVAIGLAILVFSLAPQRIAILCAAPILLLWGLAPTITAWLNRSPREPRQYLGPAEEAFILAHALRIWRYFHEFGGQRHNYLIPDNVEEGGIEAARVSPTNLGLLLNARQAAVELGFLTVPEFVALTEKSLATITKLEKHRGHLYNWYKTDSLDPLTPITVSSVDSGNFVASLYTLAAGALAFERQPLLRRELFSGLRTHWQLIRSDKQFSSQLGRLSLPNSAATVDEWIAWLPQADAALSSVDAANAGNDQKWWLHELRNRIGAILTLIHDYTPWLLPEYKTLRELPALGLKHHSGQPTIDCAAAFAENLAVRLAAVPAKNFSQSTQIELLRASLPSAAQNLRALSQGLRDLARRAECLADDTEFAFLVVPGRRMLSIGYDVTGEVLHQACYDLLASEARIATFLAIARGDLPQKSWLSLGREYACAFNHFLLLSWTATMFEYLMPALWMRSYPDTLIAHTQTACVQVQQAFAHPLNIPWGISESGFAERDDAGNYGYQAFGIPQAALKFDAVAGPTISPYSTFIALPIDPPQALRNLRRMDDAGWVGAYGFYEAADYAPSAKHPVVVREWMAHHQGMSLLAILNLLRDHIVQRWFHANPIVKSTELLLNEFPPRKSVLRAQAKESTPAAKAGGKTAST